MTNVDQSVQPEITEHQELALNTNIGNMRYICNKTRVCGKSICVLITTYILIIFPTVIFFALV